MSVVSVCNVFCTTSICLVFILELAFNELQFCFLICHLKSTELIYVKEIKKKQILYLLCSVFLLEIIQGFCLFFYQKHFWILRREILFKNQPLFTCDLLFTLLPLSTIGTQIFFFFLFRIS